MEQTRIKRVHTDMAMVMMIKTLTTKEMQERKKVILNFLTTLQVTYSTKTTKGF